MPTPTPNVAPASHSRHILSSLRNGLKRRDPMRPLSPNTVWWGERTRFGQAGSFARCVLHPHLTALEIEDDDRVLEALHPQHACRLLQKRTIIRKNGNLGPAHGPAADVETWDDSPFAV